jgi:hypothetical protein
VLDRLRRALVPLGSGLVALVLSHSLVYLVRYGSVYGEALAHEGHDLAWAIAVWSSGLLGAGLSLAGLVRLVQLGRAAASRDPLASAGSAANRVTATHWLRDWVLAGLRLALITAMVLTIQENVEHLATGLPLQGPAMLVRPEYPFALAIVVAVSFGVSLVVALYRRRRDELLARLSRARVSFAVVQPPDLAVRDHLVPPASVLGRIGGLRAPPALFDS